MELEVVCTSNSISKILSKKKEKNVAIITGNNRTEFDKIPGVKYHVVPFTSEEKNPEKIPGQCDF